MPNVGPLSDKDRLELNKVLRQAQELQADVEKALTAGIDEVMPVGERCVDCQERIKKIKAVYFPNKP